MRASRPWSGELRDRYAGAALVPPAEAERLHARVFPQHLGDARPQRSRAFPMDDAQRLEVGADGGVESLHNDVIDVTHALAAQVDLPCDVFFGQVAHDRHRLALPRLLLE